MDSPHSDARTHLGHLREAIRSGDWPAARDLSHSLSQCAVPPNPGELGDYLEVLRQTLLMAKSSRSVSAAALARVRAAAAFSS